MAKGEKQEKRKTLDDKVAREFTINIHKRIHGRSGSCWCCVLCVLVVTPLSPPIPRESGCACGLGAPRSTSSFWSLCICCCFCGSCVCVHVCVWGGSYEEDGSRQWDGHVDSVPFCVTYFWCAVLDAVPYHCLINNMDCSPLFHSAPCAESTPSVLRTPSRPSKSS